MMKKICIVIALLAATCPTLAASHLPELIIKNRPGLTTDADNVVINAGGSDLEDPSSDSGPSDLLTNLEDASD